MNARRSTWLALALGLAACASPSGAVDLNGAPCDPLAVRAPDVHVLVFTSAECPIANSYAPTLRELAAASRAQPVRWFLVHVDPDLDAAAARRHADEYELPGTVLRDPQQTVAHALGITKTPEAAVLTSKGLAYRGRIDDQWRALGTRAQSASRRDLADAVANALAGRPTPPPWPAAVGCLLPEPRR